MDRAHADLELLEALMVLTRTAEAQLAELRGLRADLRRIGRQTRAPELVSALEEYFGPGVFTAHGLLTLAAEDPHGQIGVALAELIDLNASPRSRATALGALLRRLPELEMVAQQRGVAVYRVRTSPG
jgi:hypothetical protein